MLYPKKYITAKVPISDTGTATTGDEGGARAPQKEKYDDDDQHDGDDQRALDVLDGSADRRRPVENGGDVDALGDGGSQRRQLGRDALDGLDDVCARLAVDDDDDRRLAIQVAGSADVLRGVYDVGHIGQADSRAAVIADHQGFVLVRVGDLVIGDDVRGDQVVGDLAGGLMGILQAEHGLDVLQREAHAAELRGIDFHAHGRERASAHAHLPDALDLRKLLLDDGGSRVVQLGAVVFVRGEPEDHDGRVGRIDLAIRRIGGKVGRQERSRGIDTCLHVARGEIDVAAEVELQRDGRGAERTRRGHLGEARDVAELALQGSGDGRCHDLRAGARQARGNGDGRKINLRQRRDREHREGDGSGHGNRDRQQRGGNGPPDEGCRQDHGSSGGGGWFPGCAAFGAGWRHLANRSKKM